MEQKTIGKSKEDYLKAILNHAEDSKSKRGRYSHKFFGTKNGVHLTKYNTSATLRHLYSNQKKI